MSEARRRERWFGYACLATTIVGWGVNWPAMKILLREWPPLFTRGASGLIATLILAGVALRRGERAVPSPRALPRLLATAFVNVFAWMGFTTVALKWISVAEASLLVYTMPIWATLFAWPLAGERPTARGLLALVLGFAGVAVILGGPAHASAEGQTAGAVLALAAAILFGLGTVLNRAPPVLPPVSLVAWQVGLGCLPMFALGLAFEHPDPGALSATGWILFAYMTAVPMALCYLAWFAALRALPPASASTGMLMVPIIGVASASAALGEPFGLREAAAMILTLSGVALALFRS